MQNLLDVLTDMRDGAVLMDCNEKFSQMVAAVLETGKGGEIKLTIKVKPSKVSMKNNEGVIEVELEHAITTKVPELPVGKAVFFVTDDQRLSRNNPKQEEMFRQMKEESARG